MDVYGKRNIPCLLLRVFRQQWIIHPSVRNPASLRRSVVPAMGKIVWAPMTLRSRGTISVNGKVSNEF